MWDHFRSGKGLLQVGLQTPPTQKTSTTLSARHAFLVNFNSKFKTPSIRRLAWGGAKRPVSGKRRTRESKHRPHRAAPRRTAPHRTAPHRTAPHRTAPHDTKPRLRMAAGATAGRFRRREIGGQTSRAFRASIHEHDRKRHAMIPDTQAKRQNVVDNYNQQLTLSIIFY